MCQPPIRNLHQLSQAELIGFIDEIRAIFYKPGGVWTLSHEVNGGDLVERLGSMMEELGLAPLPLDTSNPDYCPKTEDHIHTVDIKSVVGADGTADTVDVACSACGQSGSFSIDPREVCW